MLENEIMMYVLKILPLFIIPPLTAIFINI
jgi:hypothetical protein